MQESKKICDQVRTMIFMGSADPHQGQKKQKANPPQKRQGNSKRQTGGR